jgi:NAD(P)-dependent dehydrogenase (short-subunit alcohol dehydrogenase family)
MSQTGKLRGQTALVTGGGVGIGRATALAFAREGARVVIGNRNVERGEETVALIEQAGGEAAFRRTDVTVATDLAALVELAVERFGRLDCAFNNAGIFTHLAPITDQSEEDFDRVMATNTKGVWLAMKYELKQMQRQGHGTIVNNASVGGLIGGSNGTANYTASKHAVLGLTKCAALENVRRNIRVNAVAPAVIDTGMGAAFAGDLKLSMAEFGRLHPIGRVGTPEEIAAAIVWLCSDAPAFLTGHTLTIDGGYTAQ